MKIITIIKNTLPYGISNYFVKKHNLVCKLLETPSSEQPPIYNTEGKQLKSIFLKDNRARDFPYGFVLGRYPMNILWDRYNYGLKNHVYSHEMILEVIGKPVRKFAFIIEGESIDHTTYALFNKHTEMLKEFNLIFTHSDKLLDKYSNAVFIPSGGVYYGTQMHGGCLDKEQYKRKNKNISLVSSNKLLCDLHKLRFDLAQYYKNNSCVDTYGTFDGGTYTKTEDLLKDYRYSIVIENDITPYRFTEKILNCFASMTIPIYIGATKIGDFFNADGIIKIQSIDIKEVDELLEYCNVDDYNDRLSAVIDNFNRVHNYLCIEDYIYNHYKSYFI